MLDGNYPGLVHNRQGAVMVLVLMVLLATILIGVTLTRTATIETKIAGNERIIISNFQKVDSAAEVALTHSDWFSSHLKNIKGLVCDFTTSGLLTGSLQDVEDLTVTLDNIGNPPPAANDKFVYSIGGKTNLEARYYKVSSHHEGENVDVLVFKMYPKAQED